MCNNLIDSLKHIKKFILLNYTFYYMKMIIIHGNTKKYSDKNFDIIIKRNQLFLLNSIK